jgi:fructose-specific phosphotransferase system component IIB
MIKKYADFTRVRTYSVLRVVNNTGSTKGAKNTIELMDIEQLKNYISEKDLEIDTKIYEDSVELVRTAIKQAEADPEAFAPIYAKAVEDYKYKKELEALNNTGENEDDNGDTDSNAEGNGDIDDLLDDLDGKNEGDNGDDE